MGQTAEQIFPMNGTAEAPVFEPAVGTADEQGSAEIHPYATAQEWQQPPVDIRISFPIPFVGWRYLVLLSGVERRRPARRKIDRMKHPLVTWGNSLVVGGMGACLGFAGLGVMHMAAISVLRQTGLLVGMQ